MIVYFSGTGNSLAVAKELSRLLGDSNIHSIVNINYIPSADEPIVWVFPVYSWGVPPVVRRHIKELKLDGHIGPHYMVCTCGDDCGLTYEMWRRDIRRRGWLARGGWSVEMPNTYVSLPGFDVDPAEKAQMKIAAMPERVKEIARAIRVGSRVEDTVRGAFPWFKTRICYPFFTRFLMSPRPFHSTEACIGCSKCARACPMKNIAMVDDRPQWGKNCAGCLACYHVCPQHAVAYGRRTANKGQYKNPL